MGFVDDIQEDIDFLFFDEECFGSRHLFDGDEIVVLVDDETSEKWNRNKKWKDEVNNACVLLFVRECDMKRRLTIGSDVVFDRKDYFVSGLWKQTGVWKLLLERRQV